MIRPFLTSMPVILRDRSLVLLIAIFICQSAASPAGADTSQLHPRNASAASSAPLLISETNETVDLITGLLSIEHDMILGQLFQRDGIVREASHFEDPRKLTLPALKEGLLAAGVPDLESPLIALETAKTQDDITKAYIGMLSALKTARETLKPSDQDLLSAVIQTSKDAIAMLDPSGTTEVRPYQECWGLMMVARSTLDALVQSDDAAVSKSAGVIAAEFDRLIAELPDPAASEPVVFDPTMLKDLIDTLTGLSSEA